MAETYNVHCSVCTGFERTALEEAIEVLKAEEITYPMEKDSRGRFVVRVNESKIDKLRELRTVDSLFIITKEFQNIEFKSDKAEALKQLQDLVPLFEWETGLRVWSRYFSFHQPITLKPQTPEEMAAASEAKAAAVNDSNSSRRLNPNLPGFRCTCYRTGENHPFQSMEVAHAVGGSIQDYFGWNVDLKNHDIEIVLFVEEQRVRVCWALTRASLHFRNLAHFGPTALRATISAGLFRYAGGAGPGQLVCDPMCGCASIPLEAAQAAPRAFHVAGELHAKAVELSRVNLTELSAGQQRSFPVEIINWDVTALPLRTSCVDLFVVDMPFGKRCGSKWNNKRLYPAALREMARAAVPESGRACILSQDKRAVQQAVSQLRTLWKISRQTSVNIGGLIAGVFLLTRTAALVS